MLQRHLHDFVFRPGDPERAILLTRIFSAVNKLARFSSWTCRHDQVSFVWNGLHSSRPRNVLTAAAVITPKAWHFRPCFTPKAFAKFSPGLQRYYAEGVRQIQPRVGAQRQPWDQILKMRETLKGLAAHMPN